jgi:general secretion pathway protein K
LFAALGVPTEAAEGYAERIVAWRTPSRQSGADDEDKLYQGAGVGYTPRRGPFESVDELWLVLGLPPAVVERVLPFVTVYSGFDGVNVIDAVPEVLAALPGMTPLKLKTFLSQRETLPANENSILAALGGAQGAMTRGSDAYRVRMDMAFDDGRRKTSEIVLKLRNDGPVLVLSWRDEIDPVTRAPRMPTETR